MSTPLPSTQNHKNEKMTQNYNLEERVRFAWATCNAWASKSVLTKYKRHNLSENRLDPTAPRYAKVILIVTSR